MTSPVRREAKAEWQTETDVHSAEWSDKGGAERNSPRLSIRAARFTPVLSPSGWRR